jgi:sugar lactone lactonase YvrE
MPQYPKSFRRVLSASLLLLLLAVVSRAQTPVALPYTMTTIAGGLVPTTYVAGTTLCPGSSTVKAMTAYGDGCAAVAGNFGAGGRGGLVVDAFGNVFVADDINAVVHMIDANTGIMSQVAGNSTVCGGTLDKEGDGCIAATATKFSSTPRGIGIDPYGNILVPGYSDNAVHIICRAASPLCTAGAPAPTIGNPIQVQVGYMGLAAGCVSSTSNAGTGASSATSGEAVGLDNKPGFSTAANALTAFKNSGTCTTSLGEVTGPRGASADIYGNVYYAETNSSRTRVVLGPLTSSYFKGNNPLYAALKTHWASPTAGYVYTVVNQAGNGTSTGGTATVTGNSCSDSTSGTTYTGAATDTRGDGCPYWSSSVDASSGYTNGVAVDAAGNMLFTDPGNGTSIYGGLRVLFVQGWSSASAATTAGATGSVASMGVAMYKAIVANNPGVTPQPGFVYSLAGGSGMLASPSGTAPSTTPILGNNAKIVDSTTTKLAVSPQGNIYIGDNTKVLFFDIYTGTIRVLLSSSGAASTLGGYCHGSSGSVAKSIYGDGCPVSALAPYAEFGNGNGLGVAVDGQGNLYMYDGTSYASGMLVRKVLAQGMGVQSNATLAALATVSTAAPLQALGVLQSQTLQVHFPSATAASAVMTTSPNSTLTYGSQACTWYSSVDNSADCSMMAMYTPNAAGSQSATVTVAAAGGESITINLQNTVTGSVLVVDNATSGGTSLLSSSALLSGVSPVSVALDGSGNLYEASGTSILESQGASSSSTLTLASGLPAAPTKIAVDQTGNIFYLNGSSTIQELAVSTAGSPATYTQKTISYTPSNLGTANPVAIAVDPAGNLLVADVQNSAGTIYRISPAAVITNSQTFCSYPAGSSTLPSLCQSTVYNVGAFGVIMALAVDPNGNIFVADATNSAVYKLTAGVDETSTDSTYKQFVYVESTVLPGTAADALATDAAGNLYVQIASTTAGVTEYPLSGPTAAGVTVLNAVTTPAGIAVGGKGNLYSADASQTSVTKVTRNTLTEDFASSQTTEFVATLTNAGNQTSTLQASTASSGAQATDFTLAGSSNYGCTFNNSLLAAMTAGQACGMTAYFPALGNTQETDYILFAPTSPATATAGQLTLTGLANTEAFATTTAIGTASTNAPIFAASGTEVSFPITVTASSTSTDSVITNNTNGPTTSNYVSVSIDAGASTNYNFTTANGLSASLTLSLSGLTAGSHAFSVNFPQQGELQSSSATSGTIVVGPLGTTINWSPGTSTQQVSAAIGNGVLNAMVSPSVAGNFVYSVTGVVNCTSTTAATIDASTYLPIGSYTIYATFCPVDLTDYQPSSSSISYSVTQASTTAAVGASTMVVAPGGANYTSLSAALAALPATGGAIYLAPGTYSGQNVVSYPNVQLRGLGGDPTQVILTGENGAFSSSLIPTYYPSGSSTASSWSLGPAGKGGDEGSATLDVSKSNYMGQQGLSGTFIPNNFYAEYLTIQNTYNTDPNTTTYYDTKTGSCAVDSNATSLQTLYNNGTQCNSQALALYMNADQAVLNSVNLVSQQDTLYASVQGCGTYCTVARQYIWKGLITGNVDYVFGDAALVFDHTNFFTTWHGLAATNEETIEAQNKRYPTGTTPTTVSSNATSQDYLSGFVCNSCKLMSQSTGMTKLYYGRPYDISTSSYPSSYSTFILLNSLVDQVNPSGWIGWDGASQYLSTSTYGEFNTQALNDPAVGTYPYPYSLFNSTPSVLYSGNSANTTTNSLMLAGGNTGSYGVLASSATPANRESNATTLNAASAVPYYPLNFLTTSVPTTKLATGASSTWNPVAALAARVNSFVPAAGIGAITYGSSVTILGRPQTPGAGVIPTGTYAFYDSLGTNQSCTAASTSCTALASGVLDGSGEAYLTTSSLASGTHFITMVYGGDTNFAGSTSSVYSVSVLNPGQAATTTALNVNNTSSTTGTPISGSVTVAPGAATGVVQLYLDGAAQTSCTLSSGVCSWSIGGPAAGAHTLYAYYAGNSSYGYSTSSSATLEVVAPVATGDTRTVTEPAVPALCQQLNAALATDVSIQDLDTTVDATITNIDGARIQAALNACSGTGQAVELSMDSTGAYNAFLSGPLSMPSNVTLLVDPGVTLYFSRNVQDYDKTPGTNTCGTINAASATGSCKPLIDIPGSSTNVGIMGYGKLNGRGGDALLNAFASPSYSIPSSPTWWSMATLANGVGNQQNPRFIQAESGSSNITLYKITIMNSPMFHVSTTGSVTGLTAWGVKIVTPTAARNTDGIDPGSVTNGTIANSWISDGDDNVAVGGHSHPSNNLSIINNHFFAGHGESIGSLTDAGVSNILFDHNMLAGNNVSGYGSSQWGLTPDGNSTGIRIKSASNSGGAVTNIQYSNSCILDHKADIQFTPYYSSTDGVSYPNFNNILMQNLVFLNDANSAGTVEMDGYYNSNGDISGGSAVTNPLGITMDNVTLPSALSTLVASTAPAESSSVWNYGGYSGGTGQYVNLSVGPGQVSSNFLTLYNALAANSANNDTLTNNTALNALNPPACVFTYLAPELTGPNGIPQTVYYGNPATLDVILTPAVGGAPYPGGSVTLQDAQTSNTFTGTFNGTGDTIAVTIPASDLTVGTHTFSATSYTGDTNYTVPPSYQTFGSYVVTVTAAPQTIAFAPSVTSYTYAPNGTFNVSATASSGLAVSFASTTAGICSVSGSTVTMLGGGTCIIQATQAGNTNYQAAPVVSVNFTISAANQTITFAPSVTSYTYAPNGTFGLSATATSNLAVSFASTTASICSVSSSTVTMLGGGTCTIQATQAGNASYNAAALVSVNFTIGAANQTITFAPSVTSYTYAPNGTFSLSATATSNLAVSFASTTASICSVSGSTVTMLGGGTCTIQATQAGNASYNAAALVSVNFTIGAANQTITFAPPVTSYTYASNGTFSLSATATSNLAVSFASTTASICSVSGSTVTILSGGTCTIKATQAGNASYNAAAPVSVNFTIGLATPAVAVSSGLNPVLLSNPVTFTAKVTATAGSPTGTVNFLDGTTVIGSGLLASGTATFTTSSLALGSHTISAAYLGDTNFSVTGSGSLPQSVITINVGSGSSNPTSTTGTAAPGGTAAFSLSILPSTGNSFPTALTLSLSGLPAGAVASITPSSWVQSTSTSWTLAANTVLNGNTQINIQLPAQSASNRPESKPFGRGLETLAAFLLLLPFARKMRKAGRKLQRMAMVLLLLAAAVAGITACGSSSGFFTQGAKTYTVVVTVSSGPLSQSTNLTLTVE